MRTFARTLINAALLIAALGTELWLSARPVFLHASAAARTWMSVAVFAAYLTVAWFAMRALKPKPKPQAASTAWTPARPVRKRARAQG